MPRVKIEYTANLEENPETLEALMLRIHHHLVELAGASIGDCKSYVQELGVYCFSDGQDKRGFVVATVQLIEGRSPETKEKLGRALFQELSQHFRKDLEKKAPQIRVELLDIKKNYYFTE